MLSNTVSIADIVVGQVLFRLAAMFWQNPVAAMVVLLSLTGLAAILWWDVWTGASSASHEARDMRPMQLRR